MKKITVMAICFVLTLSFSGCGKAELKLGKEVSTAEETTFDVSMDIVEGTVHPTGLTIRISNNTNLEIDSGNANDFAIEAQKDRKWYSIDIDERAITSEAMVFEGTRDVEISWNDIYGQLPKGQYRIVKAFWPRSEDGACLDNQFCLSAEFSIE